MLKLGFSPDGYDMHLLMQNDSLPPPSVSTDGNSQPPPTPLPPEVNQTESNMTIATDSQDSSFMECDFPQKKRGGWPKGRKRRRGPRDVNAPKQPLSGYIRYLNDNREKVRTDNPGASFSEVTKLLAVEWSKIGADEKQKYLDEAEKDKERYMKELEQYQQTEAYQMFKKQQEINRKADFAEDANDAYYNSAILDQAMAEPIPEGDAPGFDIPIFTEEFLDHNKAREAELRQLRKSNTEYEEQNAILTKHIDNMKSAIEKLESETAQQQINNYTLKDHLDRVRSKMLKNFADFPLPNTGELPTIETIDSYMTRLHCLLENPQENETVINQVRDMLRKMDYP